jgi:beta-phosphoglucomutase-like phosphatase (HAD superfamily)
LIERSRRLGEERVETVQLLRSLGHDLHATSRLVDWLEVPTLTRGLLGLPADVVACVFDLDGVLTTSPEAHATAWAEAFDPFLLAWAERSGRLFIPFDRRDEYERFVAGKPRIDGVRTFLASRGIGLPEGASDDPTSAESIHGLANRKNLALQRRLQREGVAAYEGSRCYLEAAQRLGLRRAVVSASANTGAILERAGLAHLVEDRIDGNAIRVERLRPEPAPDAILAACERLGVESCKVAAFATTPTGVRAAQAAHAELVIGVDRSGYADRLLISGADVVIGDLTELIDHKLIAR